MKQVLIITEKIGVDKSKEEEKVAKLVGELIEKDCKVIIFAKDVKMNKLAESFRKKGVAMYAEKNLPVMERAFDDIIEFGDFGGENAKLFTLLEDTETVDVDLDENPGVEKAMNDAGIEVPEDRVVEAEVPKAKPKKVAKKKATKKKVKKTKK